MTNEQISVLLTRLLISFLTKQWKGRTHFGLVDRIDVMSTEDIHEEVARFVGSLM